jgi:hypothetical protein
VFAQVVRSQPEAQGTGIALEVSGVRVVVERGFDAKVLREIVDALTDGDS